jgi:hypothetical protein
MPTVTPNSPGEFSPFDSDFEHVKAHRALETAVEGLDTTFAGSTITANTASTLVLIANRVGLGGAVPTTSSTAAPVKGIFRTAAVVGSAVGWIATNSVYVATFSVASQTGNTIQRGDPVDVVAISALPTNAVQLGGGLCVDTNTIQVAFLAFAGGINTTTVSFHVFSVDIT